MTIPTPVVDRVTRRILVSEDGCWEWQGGRTPLGYGMLKVDRHMRQAHRVAYELFVGPIPEGLVLDHLCRNPPCCNPAHLEPVTQRENILRGVAPAANYARRTHCKHGHEFTPDNTGPRVGGARRCRACDRELHTSRRQNHG